MIDHPIPLSPDGRRRREEILALALGQARRRRRRRQFARATILCAAIAVAVPIMFRFHKPTPPAPRMVQVSPQPQQTGGIVITRFQTEPGIADRLAIPSVPPHWHRMSDDELLRQLQAAGHPAALASIQGHEMLLFHHEPVPSN